VISNENSALRCMWKPESELMPHVCSNNSIRLTDLADLLIRLISGGFSIIRELYFRSFILAGESISPALFPNDATSSFSPWLDHDIEPILHPCSPCDYVNGVILCYIQNWILDYRTWCIAVISSLWLNHIVFHSVSYDLF